MADSSADVCAFIVMKGPRRHPRQWKSALYWSVLHLVSRLSNHGGLSVTPGRGPRGTGAPRCRRA
eukprot:9380310-Pyramimonas_sp.AAC.1